MKTISMVLACLFVMIALFGCAMAETVTTIPQIDNSTARIPITDAIYAYFTEQGATGPKPICSKTHGAWLNLADGTADIIFLVAPTADELQVFADAGIDIEMKVFGYDGLVFMGNASNPLDNISSADIRAIYRGDVTDWWQVDGSSAGGEIVAYIRNPESGSQRLFENLVWNGYELPDFQSISFEEGEVKGASARKVETDDDMADVIYDVMQYQFSIGYNIMSYVDNVFMSGESQKAKVLVQGGSNLRGGFGLDKEIIGTIKEDTELEYTYDTCFDERDVAWYCVRYKDDYAWVSSKVSKLKMDESALKLFSVDGVAPTTENFANGSYPYVTTSYVAIRADEPEDSPARQLFDWIGSDESREIIEKNSTLSVDFSDSVVIHASAGDPTREEVRTLINDLPEYLLDLRTLHGLTEDELVYLWQACYAHAGLQFHQDKYQKYFSEMEWYEPELMSYRTAYEYMDWYTEYNSDRILKYLTALRRATAAIQPRTYAYNDREEMMEGEDVREVNEALVDLKWMSGSYYLDTYSQASQRAVEGFQRMNGLEPTGVFDLITRMMLM